MLTSPRRVKKCTLTRVSPSLLFMSTGTRRCTCQNRPIQYEQFRALAVLKFEFVLLFALLPLKLHSSKANAGKTCCIKASHVKDCLRVICNTRICAPFYVWTTRVSIATMGVFGITKLNLILLLTCDKYSAPSRPSL